MEYTPFSIFDQNCLLSKSNSRQDNNNNLSYCDLRRNGNKETDPNGLNKNSIENLNSGLFDSTVNSIVTNELNSKLQTKDPKEPIINNFHEWNPKSNIKYLLHNPGEINLSLKEEQLQKSVTQNFTDKEQNKQYIDLDKNETFVKIVDLKVRNSEFTHFLESTIHNVDDIRLLKLSCKNIFSTISPYNNTLHLSDNLYDNYQSRTIVLNSPLTNLSSTQFVTILESKLNENLLEDLSLPPDNEKVYTITKLQSEETLYKLQNAIDVFYLHSFEINQHSFVENSSNSSKNYYDSVILNIPNVGINILNDLNIVIKDKVGNIFIKKTIQLGISDKGEFINKTYTPAILESELKIQLNKSIPPTLQDKFEYVVLIDLKEFENFPKCLIQINRKTTINGEPLTVGSNRSFQIHESNLLDIIGITAMKEPKLNINGTFPVDLDNYIKNLTVFINETYNETIHYNSKDNRNIIEWNTNNYFKNLNILTNRINSLSKLNIKITNGEYWDSLYDLSNNTLFFLKIAIYFKNHRSIN